MKALMDGLRALGPARLAAMGAVALGMLGMLALMVLRGGTEPMALLYGDLDLRDASQVVDQLARQPHPVPHRRQREPDHGARPTRSPKHGWPWPTRVCPPAAPSVTRSSIAPMASPPPNSSRRSTRPARWRAKSRGLSAPCNGMRAVRVHLVLPRREPFARERQEAQASVMLTMAGVARLDREGIQAILNLVAAAVPGLRPQNIAIVDFAWRPAGARRRAGWPRRDRALDRGSPARHRTAAFTCGRGDAGAQSGRRPCACRGGGAHELRPG